MKRRNITPQENTEQNIQFNSTVGMKQMILREPSIVDEFYFEKSKNLDDKEESVSVVDPIIILFNQQRLDNMGSSAAKAFIDSLAPKSNPLQELRKNCSDEDLSSMIKSRHLQSLAEILAWSRYMKNNIDEFNTEVQRLVEARQAEEQKKSETATTEPVAQTS